MQMDQNVVVKSTRWSIGMNWFSLSSPHRLIDISETPQMAAAVFAFLTRSTRCLVSALMFAALLILTIPVLVMF
jgi:hypothetical protein